MVVENAVRFLRFGVIFMGYWFKCVIVGFKCVRVEM